MPYCLTDILNTLLAHMGCAYQIDSLLRPKGPLVSCLNHNNVLGQLRHAGRGLEGIGFFHEWIELPITTQKPDKGFKVPYLILLAAYPHRDGCSSWRFRPPTLVGLHACKNQLCKSRCARDPGDGPKEIFAAKKITQ